MATTATSRVPPPASRRSPSVSSTTSGAPSIAKGATARSAVSPRVSASVTSPVARRASIKAAASPVAPLGGETREFLAVSLKQETDKKEQLLLQLQNKEQTITNLTTENDHLSTALNSAESRLSELYADQGRQEEEMAARLEVIDKLRAQVREMEKEKRDVQRRYNEQTTTFEAERQAFYDNEQHLKSRIQSLTQARKQPPLPVPPSESSISLSESETEVEEEEPSSTVPEPAKQDISDPEQEPAEMTALKLELSTLSTSYASMQSTLHLLQSQLVDLKRVNNHLQEENEAYNILLQEKTLSGQFNVSKIGRAESGSEESESDEDADGDTRDEESLRSKTPARSILDPVDELTEPEHELDPEFEQLPREELDPDEAESQRNSRRLGRKRGMSTSQSHSPTPRGESLANLPITGPGLDLAAELGRAENKDIVEGRVALDTERSVVTKHKKGRKSTASEAGHKTSGEDGIPLSDMDALRSEVKSLRDANKALSLYASKIIDRIIAQEGFEHVLAIDYEKNTSPSPPKESKKGRPQSAIFGSGSASLSPNPQTPSAERLTTFESLQNSPPAPAPPPASASSRASRRSLSFDWKSFSMFGGDKKAEANPNLRPLTLKANSASVVTGARKLETHEDEEDRRERERLHATMKLMGIEKPLSPSMPPMQKSFSSPADPQASTSAGPPSPNPNTPPTATPATPSSRFSFFRRTSSMTAASESSSIDASKPGSGGNTPGLTQEALEQAEAESTIAALEAHERQLSAEIAKGSSGGFTEIVRRTGDRRSSRRSGESASTVWSAGMSRGDEASD